MRSTIITLFRAVHTTWNIKSTRFRDRVHFCTTTFLAAHVHLPGWHDGRNRTLVFTTAVRIRIVITFSRVSPKSSRTDARTRTGVSLQPQHNAIARIVSAGDFFPFLYIFISLSTHYQHRLYGIQLCVSGWLVLVPHLT